MSESKLSAAKQILTALAESPGLGEGWVLDDRFTNVVMRVVSKEDMRDAWSTLERIFPKSFEEDSLGSASNEIQHLVSQMGGLRGDQFLFVHEDASGLVSFTAMWPWQNAPQASFRLGFVGIDRLEESVFERLLVEA